MALADLDMEEYLFKPDQMDEEIKQIQYEAPS